MSPTRKEGTGRARRRKRSVDLSRNEPPDLRIAETLRRSLVEMARDCDLDGMLSYGHSQGQPRHRESAWPSGSVATAFRPIPRFTIITSGAQQALTVALGASGPARRHLVGGGA